MGEPPRCHRGQDGDPDGDLEKHRCDRGLAGDRLEKHPRRCHQGRCRWGSRGGTPGEEKKSTWDGKARISYLKS